MHGTQTSLYAPFRPLLGPGDEILLGDPMYATYEGLIAQTGATMVPVPLRPERGFRIDAADVAARIMALKQDRLVITGGEPLLQGAALARMVAMLEGVSVEIETNGTVAPHPALDPLVAQYNVSPKLAHSGNPADLPSPSVVKKVTEGKFGQKTGEGWYSYKK